MNASSHITCQSLPLAPLQLISAAQYDTEEYYQHAQAFVYSLSCPQHTLACKLHDRHTSSGSEFLSYLFGMLQFKPQLRPIPLLSVDPLPPRVSHAHAMHRVARA